MIKRRAADMLINTAAGGRLLNRWSVVVDETASVNKFSLYKQNMLEFINNLL